MWHRRHILPGRYATAVLPAARHKAAPAARDRSTLSRLHYDHPVSGSARPRSVTRVPYRGTGDMRACVGTATAAGNAFARTNCMPLVVFRPHGMRARMLWGWRSFPDRRAGFCRVQTPRPLHAVCARTLSKPSPVPVYVVSNPQSIICNKIPTTLENVFLSIVPTCDLISLFSMLKILSTFILLFANKPPNSRFSLVIKILWPVSARFEVSGTATKSLEPLLYLSFDMTRVGLSLDWFWFVNGNGTSTISLWLFNAFVPHIV